MTTPCGHMLEAGDPIPSGEVCQSCVDAGLIWVHLRLCTSCGTVACCDDSPGRHARAHARATQHPVIRSFEPGETWWWCFPDERFVERRSGYAAAR